MTHLSKIVTHLSKIVTHLCKIVTHLSKIVTHLSKIVTHLSKILSFTFVLQQSVSVLPAAMLLVGNKLDLDEFAEREVSTQTGQDFAKVNGQNERG